jgi:hypothetical protein
MEDTRTAPFGTDTQTASLCPVLEADLVLAQAKDIQGVSVQKGTPAELATDFQLQVSLKDRPPRQKTAVDRLQNDECQLPSEFQKPKDDSEPSLDKI